MQPPPSLRMAGVSQYASPEELAHARAVEFAEEEGQPTNGYTGTGYGRYTAAERRAASGLASMFFGRPATGVRFQGGARVKPMKGSRGLKSPSRASPQTTRAPTRRSPRRRRRRASMESSFSRPRRASSTKSR